MKKKAPKTTANTLLRASDKADAERSVVVARRIAASILKQHSNAKTSPAKKNDWHPLRPPNEPDLIIKRGKTFALTPSGILQQAQAQNQPDKKQPEIVSAFRLQLNLALNPTWPGVAIDKLVPLAANEFEEQMFRLIHNKKPDLFAEYDDPLKALLHLRVIYIPRLCRRLLSIEIAKGEAEILWLGALAAYSVAFERILLERYFRATSKPQFVTSSAEEIQKRVIGALGSTTTTWFDKAEEGHKYWLLRFDQWLDYAMRSLDHFLARQSIDYRKQEGELKRAAHLGILKLLNAVPQSRFANLLDGVNTNGATRKMFNKSAKKRPTKLPNLEFESWLIECWPLVLEYGWSYRELHLVAEQWYNKKIDTKLGSVESLKEICTKLGLKLGGGRNKVGRPTSSQITTLPILYQLALKIEGLDDVADWFWGVTEAGFNNFKAPLSE